MPNNHEYISTIVLPDSNEYYVKDAEAREELTSKIDNPASKSSGQYLKFNGTNWVAGDVVIPQGVEYQANKVSSWQQTPDNIHYPSELLVKTEADNIRAVAEGKTKSYVINTQNEITGTKGSDDNYTNVTAITGVTLTDLKVGDVILIKAIDVPDYWVSQINPSVSLNKMETSKIDLTQYVSKAEAGDLAYKDSASGTYTPSGSVSTPTITVSPTTTTVNSITDVGSLPTWSASVTSEVLSFNFTQGTLPTKSANQTVMTGASATSSQPTFTGTQATITVE